MKINKLIITLFLLLNFANIIYARGGDTYYSDKITSKKRPVILFIITTNRKGDVSAVLTSPLINQNEFSGTVETISNKIIFDINSYKYFVNWDNGWTEGINQARGQIIFIKNSGKLETKISEEIKIMETIKGKIRYFDDYYVNKKGKTKVKARMARIRAINVFIKTNLNIPYFEHYKKKTQTPGYKKTVKPFLFDKELKYPKHLIELKNSGTIRRDFEESYPLMFADYNMEYLLNNLLPGSVFIKK